jgi:hypothetical protein
VDLYRDAQAGKDAAHLKAKHTLLARIRDFFGRITPPSSLSSSTTPYAIFDKLLDAILPSGAIGTPPTPVAELPPLRDLLHSLASDRDAPANDTIGATLDFEALLASFGGGTALAPAPSLPVTRRPSLDGAATAEAQSFAALGGFDDDHLASMSALFGGSHATMGMVAEELGGEREDLRWLFAMGNGVDQSTL